ncbi:zinc finger, CCHC-type containing protein [Tanacetum coccineum]
MFRLNIVNNNIGSAFMSTSKVNDSILWHARLGHVHFRRMQDMSKDGLILAFDVDTEKCKTCMLTKITKKPFQNVKRKTKVLELIHSDLYDLHATPSLGNKKYFVTFIDDASRFCYVYLLHLKDEALDKFKVFKTEVELQQGSLIKRFRIDRGGEYVDTLYFQSVGIIYEMTAPYTPQQYGISERKNKVLKEMVNSMLPYSGLGQGFWGEAIAKVTAIEDSKDLTSLSLNELVGNLKVHEMIIKKDSEIVKAKGERRSLALKAKKESSDEECSTSRSEDEEYVMAVRDFKKFFKRRVKVIENALDATTRIILLENVQNHQKIRTKELLSKALGSDSDEEDDEKVKDETCLVAQASSEVAIEFVVDTTLDYFGYLIFGLDQAPRMGWTYAKYYLESFGCIWFNHSEAKDHAIVTRKQSFTTHLLQLMCSWVVVCDVWYLEPQKIKPGEAAIQFAKRIDSLASPFICNTEKTNM